MPTRIEMHGGISTKDSDPYAKIGVGTCNRIHVSADSDGGDVLLEDNLPVSLSVLGSVGSLSLQPDCSSSGSLAVATISKGKRYAPVYFWANGAPSTWGTVSVSTNVNGAVLTNAMPVYLAASSGVDRVRFFDDRLLLGANACADLPYFAIDSAGYTVNVTSPPPPDINIFSLNDSIQSASGLMDFRTSCGDTVINELPDGLAHGQISITMGTVAIKDFRVGIFTSPQVSVNISPKAAGLDMTLANSAPYAADCDWHSVVLLDLP